MTHGKHPYTSTVDLAQAATRLRQAKNILVTTHAKPDGDGFGAVAALAALLRQRGANVTAVLMPPIHANFRKLRGYQMVQSLDGAPRLPQVDLVALLDTGAWAQIEPIREYLQANLDRVLIIDHHLSGDVPAAHRYIDAGAGSCCEIIAQLADELSGNGDGAGLADPVVAESLFVGMASDTGWFKFSNTRPQTYELAARLLRHGVDQAHLYQQLEQSERVEKLDLLVRALASLRLVANQRAALMVLTADDFRQSGAGAEETERLVDIPQIVERVQVVALITQPPPASAKGPARRSVRISLRSKPGPHAIDVAEVARQFGGGGHARAAAAQVQGTLQEVVARVEAELVKVMSTDSA